MVVFPGELLLLLVDIHMASLNGGMSLPKYHLECSRRGLPLDRDLDFYIDRGRAGKLVKCIPIVILSYWTSCKVEVALAECGLHQDLQRFLQVAAEVSLMMEQQLLSGFLLAVVSQRARFPLVP